MSILGLSLIKKNTFERLYNNVDKILLTNSGKDTIQKDTVAHSIQHMLSVDKWFSICAINECAKVSNIVISTERLDIYRAIHCINWSSMTPDYREMIIAMVLDDFRTILNPKKEDDNLITLEV